MMKNPPKHFSLKQIEGKTTSGERNKITRRVQKESGGVGESRDGERHEVGQDDAYLSRSKQPSAAWDRLGFSAAAVETD